ncbi:MAG: hypothetical protein ABJE95_20620 [Byssovorax sp.]
MADIPTGVAPTSPGQGHHNTLIVRSLQLCFTRCPGARDAGIGDVPYKVLTDFLSLGGKQIFASPPNSTAEGTVTIPWRPDGRGRTGAQYMVLEIFDTEYRIFQRDEIEKITFLELTDDEKVGKTDAEIQTMILNNLGLTPGDMAISTDQPRTLDAPATPATPSKRVRAVQERLEILGYLTGFLDNDRSGNGIIVVNDAGTTDASFEQAILNFQQDDPTLEAHGLADGPTVLALLLRSEADGYRHGA